jgi:hypothetical protein
MFAEERSSAENETKRGCDLVATRLLGTAQRFVGVIESFIAARSARDERGNAHADGDDAERAALMNDLKIFHGAAMALGTGLDTGQRLAGDHQHEAIAVATE